MTFGCKKGCKSCKCLIYTLYCGERGIRTPGTSQFNGFQDRRNRPLCHLSYSILYCIAMLRWKVFQYNTSENLLSGKDSNPHRRNQNPKCYHYTTGQAFRLRSANLQLFLLLVSYCVIKIILLIFIHNCISVYRRDTKLTLMTTT